MLPPPLVAAAPEGTEASFHRAATGVEMISSSHRRLWAIEAKRSSAPTVEKGFHAACADLRPQKQFVVYPGTERFSMGNETVALGLPALAAELQAVR